MDDAATTVSKAGVDAAAGGGSGGRRQERLGVEEAGADYQNRKLWAAAAAAQASRRDSLSRSQPLPRLFISRLYDPSRSGRCSRPIASSARRHLHSLATLFRSAADIYPNATCTYYPPQLLDTNRIAHNRQRWSVASSNTYTLSC